MRTIIEIPLKPYSKGAVAIINKDKLKRVMSLSKNWYLHEPNGNNIQTYARAEVWKDGKRTRYYLHRVIMKALPTDTIDHINHNGLDCTNLNLRLATDSQNGANRRTVLPSHNSSGYVGVSFHKSRNKWRAFITHNGKYIHLGYFETPIECAKAYNDKATELFGDFARLNKL